jgi:GGDEF domain-containing protein
MNAGRYRVVAHLAQARRALGLLMAFGLFWCAAAGAAQPQTLPVAPDLALPLVVGLQPQALIERGAIGITGAAAGQLDHRLKPGSDGVVPLNSGNELWIPLRLHNVAKLQQALQLQLPNPWLDEVTLFEQRGGRWIESSAGDQVPRSRWGQPGRFPVFALRLEPGETRPLFLRVRNVVSTQVPVVLLNEATASAAPMRAELGYGFVLGALALLAAACLTMGTFYRDAAYFLYGFYALLLALSTFSVSGLASQYLWGELTDWSNALQTAFPLASAGVSVWLVRALCRVQTRGQRMARTTAMLGGAVVAVALLIAILRLTMPVLVALGMLTAAGTVLTIGVWAWRRGDAIGGWVLAAHAPLIFTTLLILLRMFGIAPLAFDAGLLAAVSIGVILVLLLIALIQRSREVLSLQVRSEWLSSIDPSTGLLASNRFGDRVRAAVGRYNQSQHDAAVLYVRLSNYARIRDLHGTSVAEQSMIRVAMKLQRLMPDADCVGRVGESTLGLILETVTRRDALSERAARLVAHGLMPLPGLVPEVLLKLQVVGNVLSDNPLDAGPLQTLLESTLASMSPRSRRPIRFLEPAPVRAGALEGAAPSPDSPRSLAA